MSKERENIFSWRKQLRGMNAQERVDFYYGKLKQGYQQSVLEAELARQQARKPNDSHDKHIQDSFKVWASEETQRRLNAALERRRAKGLNVENGQVIIDLGLAGHFLVKGVHETTMASKARWWQVGERRQRLENTREVFKRWPTVERTTLCNPSTIHGGPIDWELEVTQNKVNYWLVSRRPDGAARIAEQGVSLASIKIGSWLSKNLPNDPEIVASNVDLHLRTIRGKVEENKFEELAGLLSARATLEYRKGLVTRELEPLVGALRDISAVQQEIPNNHRFATINWKVLFASLLYHGNFSLGKRIIYFTKAAENLWKTARVDPRSVVRSFLQMF